MTQKRKYQLISEIENWTLPFFKASSGFCPLYSPTTFESGAALSHGLNLSEERKYRILIIKYMFEAGENMNLPYNTVCIGIIYFHKFFQSISIRAHDPYYISTSCLFTAGKQEETRVRLDKCARFLYDYKYNKFPSSPTTSPTNYKPPTKHEIERICKKLSIAELLCTQINKFNYNINLPFDYLLPIICQWKSVYIPHQTNNKTLKYIYALNAFKFIKQSFYIPINIIIPPQKIAIVCMELSLRLNYNKYQTQQEQINCNSSMEMEYKYIDPPLQWFRIFDINANQQDLKDEINLIALEIINAIQNFQQFGIQNVETGKKMLSHWRRGSLNIDKVHQDLIDRQTKHICKTNDNNYNYSNDRDRYNISNEHLFSGTELIQYPYNCSNDISLGELLNVNNNKTAIIMKHRYKIQKQVELSLAFNNQTISPASLNPHKFFTLYPLKNQCFDDVDREYNQQKEKEKEKQERERERDRQRQRDREREKHNKSKRKSNQKKKKYKSRRESSGSDSSNSHSTDDSDSGGSSSDSNDKDESKSNAVRKSNKNDRNDKKKREKDEHEHGHGHGHGHRKRKRSESIDKNKDFNRKKRRIERKKSVSSSDNSDDDDSDSSNNSSDNTAISKTKSKSKRKRTSRKDRKHSKSDSRSHHNHNHKKQARNRSNSSSKSNSRDRNNRKSSGESRDNSRYRRDRRRDHKSKSHDRSSSASSSSNGAGHKKDKRDRHRRDRYNKRRDNGRDNRDRKKKNIPPRYKGGYFTPDPRTINNKNNGRNNNNSTRGRYRGRGHRRGGGHIGRNNRNNNRMNNINMGVMGMNIGVNGMGSSYFGNGNDGDVFDGKDTKFDYGLTPNNIGGSGGGGREDEQVNDDQLRQVLMLGGGNGNGTGTGNGTGNGNDRHGHGHGHGNSKEFNEEKTQRNANPPVSPLLKALKNNKSALYTNMIIPSRREDQ